MRNPRGAVNRLAPLRWVLVCALAGCGGGGGGGGGGAKLQSIAVTPVNRSIAVAMTVQLTATGTFSDGSSANLTGSVSWASGAPSVSVSAAGLASAQQAGAATITATLGTVSGNTALTVAPPVPGATVWNFDNAQSRLAALSGPAGLSYRDPAASGWGPQLTTFANASALGLPLVNGENSTVMAFPATTPDQGYTITHHSAPNGVFADDNHVSNYTLVMDVLWPQDNAAAFRGLFQTDEMNSDDADTFIKIVSGGKLGVGINASYNEYGAFAPGTWHRVTIVVQCALGPGGTGQIYRYVDGLFVRAQYMPDQAPGERCRWALGDTLHLFTDDDGETAIGYASSILYVDRLMSPDEIAALGGPHASGANVPGPAAPAPPQVASRRVLIFGHRGNSGYAPENTLAAITQSFDAGVDHVECDVGMSADGELVLMHDATVDRTTDGTGAVDSLSLAAIKALDAGSWYDPLYAGEPVPTLVEALIAADGRGKLLLDVKVADEAAAIKQALDDAGVTQGAIWPSTEISAVAADYQANLPDAGILWGAVPPSLTTAAFDDLKAQGAVGFDVFYETVTQEFVDAAHANGMFVVVYTALDPEVMLQMIDLGVDGIETDFPAVLDSLMPAPLN